MKKFLKQHQNLIIIFLTVMLICLLDSSNTWAKPKCDPSDYQIDADECWFCPMFKVLFNAASTIALKSYSTLSKGVANLVLMGFAVWTSFFVLKHVTAFQAQQPSKIIQEYLLQAFKVLLVVLILRIGYFQIISLTLGPVFDTGMAYTQSIGNSGAGCPSDASYMKNIRGYGKKGFSESSAGGLPASMGQNIVCSIKKMQDSIHPIVAAGKMSNCLAWRQEAIVPFVIPRLSYLITGIALYVSGIFLMLGFPFYLIDSVLQMSIAAALAPAAIGSWAFKMTNKYLSKIWDMFMNAMFQFIFLSIIIYIIVTVVNQFLTPIIKNAGETGSWEKLIDPVDGFSIWGANMLKLFITACLGWVFLSQGGKMASHFASAPNLSMGKDIGGLAASAASRVALGTKDKDGNRHGGMLGAGKAVGRFAKEKGDKYIGSAVRLKFNQRKADWIKKHGTEIRDADGKVTGYEAKSKIFKSISRRVDIDENGNEIYSKQKNKANSNKTTQSDHMLAVKTTKDADGNVIGQEIDFKEKQFDKLVGKDGKLNAAFIQQLKKESQFDEKTIELAIAQKVLQSRGITLDSKFKDRAVALVDGKLIIEQTNENGQKMSVTCSMNGADQMLTKVQYSDGKGNSQTIIDNGIMKKSTICNAKGEAHDSYSFNSYYEDHYGSNNILDKHGNLATYVDKKALMHGFDQNDIDRHTEQRNNARKYHNNSIPPRQASSSEMNALENAQKRSQAINLQGNLKAAIAAQQAKVDTLLQQGASEESLQKEQLSLNTLNEKFADVSSWLTQNS